MEPVETIEDQGKPIAIIVRREYEKPGVSFFSPYAFSQQLGVLLHPAGHEIRPHVHNLIARDVRHTQEVLHVIQGRLEVTLYNDRREYLTSRVLNPGDTILLAHGGHGIRVLEACKVLEVKQGPYAGGDDKEFF